MVWIGTLETGTLVYQVRSAVLIILTVRPLPFQQALLMNALRLVLPPSGVRTKILIRMMNARHGCCVSRLNIKPVKSFACTVSSTGLFPTKQRMVTLVRSTSMKPNLLKGLLRRLTVRSGMIVSTCWPNIPISRIYLRRASALVVRR